MSDLAVIAGAVTTVAAVALAGRWWRRRAAESVALDLREIPGRVLLFSAASCSRCRVVRDRLESLGVDFDEIRYEDHRSLHQSAGVPGVPLLVVRDGDGAVVAQIAGVASRRKLRVAALRSAALPR